MAAIQPTIPNLAAGYVVQNTSGTCRGVKALVEVVQWTGADVADLHGTCSQAVQFCAIPDTIVSTARLWSQAGETWSSITQGAGGWKTVGALKDLFVKTSGAVESGSRLVNLFGPSEGIPVVKGIGSVADIVCAVDGLAGRVTFLNEAYNSTKDLTGREQDIQDFGIEKSWWQIGLFISVIAINLLALVGLVFSIAIASPLFTILSLAILVTSVASFVIGKKQEYLESIPLDDRAYGA